MKTKRWFLFSGISAVLAVISFITALIASTNLPSGVSYEVAKAYGNTSFEDFLFMLPNIMLIVCFVFLLIAIAMLVIGIVKKKKNS